METFKDKVQVTDTITLGGDTMVLFAGPCAAESYDLCMEVGTKMKDLCSKLGIDYVFKSSFDKANRTSAGSYRGPSVDMGLEILAMVKQKLNVPIVTDVHNRISARRQQKLPMCYKFLHFCAGKPIY